MTLPLQRESAMLILIDLQLGHLGAIQTLSPDLLTRNAGFLTQVARLYEEVTALLPGNAVLERTTANAWDAPEFVAAVETAGRRQLILAGVALDIGVALPALSAHAAGYDVAVVVDATGTIDPRVEMGTMMRLASAGIALVSWASVGMELQRDLAGPKGRDLMALIGASFAKEHNPFRDNALSGGA
jgi:hypothetical protein